VLDLLQIVSRDVLQVTQSLGVWITHRHGQRFFVGDPRSTRVVDRAVEHAVEPEDAELLVELVLVALVGGDLDDRGQLVRGAAAGGDVVPGMEAAGGPDGHSGGRDGAVGGCSGDGTC
jgi:hypothetical protein